MLVNIQLNLTNMELPFHNLTSSEQAFSMQFLCHSLMQLDGQILLSFENQKQVDMYLRFVY